LGPNISTGERNSTIDASDLPEPTACRPPTAATALLTGVAEDARNCRKFFVSTGVIQPLNAAVGTTDQSQFR
jgi:hypothetical protein